MSARNDSWRGGQVTPWAYCLIANNPSPLTYVGTNTWLVHAPGSDACVVIDPGPDDADHLELMRVFCRERGLSVAAVVVTHWHADHAGGARALSMLAKAPVYAAASGSLPEGVLRIPEAGVSLEAIALPGHSSDSMGLWLPEDASLFTGDMIFAQSSTMVCWPDGVLADYLASLDALVRFVDERGVQRFLTGHGRVIDDPTDRLMRARAHRMKRLNQVVSAVRSGIPARANDIVEAVYNDVGPELAQGARRSVNAQLRYAFDTGLLEEHENLL